jgi:polyisoprenoid-binding protein YceI
VNTTARIICLVLLTASGMAGSALAQEVTLTFAPERTTVSFTLDDVLHTVHGSFSLKSGVVHFNPATDAISGNIIVDAMSGNSGSVGRDRKMHKEVLDSSRYPEVTFQPDHVQGTVSSQGTSTVEVHGLFGIHGGEHEIVAPARVELAHDHWDLTVHFDIPYVKWGMKDPSTFVLRVEKTVAIDLHASGPNPWVAQR